MLLKGKIMSQDPTTSVPKEHWFKRGLKATGSILGTVVVYAGPAIAAGLAAGFGARRGARKGLAAPTKTSSSNKSTHA